MALINHSRRKTIRRRHRSKKTIFLFNPNHVSCRVLFLATAMLVCCSSPIGEDFEDFDAIAFSETWRDWVIVGRFGPDGPFEVAAVKSCAVGEPCSFSHKGQGHTYSIFYGYKLTILRLESDAGAVSHVVLRSKQRFDDEQ